MERFRWLSDNEAFVAIFSLVAGSVLTAAISAWRNRRVRLEYFVTHDRVGVATDDAVFGNVRVTWQGTDVTNLYLSVVELRNPTARDFSNVRFKTYTGSETILLTERTEVVGTSYIIEWAPEFQDRLRPGDDGSVTELQREVWRHRREYVVPVFARDTTIKLHYLTTVPAGGQSAVWLDMMQAGLALRFRVRAANIHGVAVSLALPVGMIASMVGVVVWVSYFRPITAAVLSLVSGWFAQSIGALIVGAVRRAKGWLFH